MAKIEINRILDLRYGVDRYISQYKAYNELLDIPNLRWFHTDEDKVYDLLYKVGEV